MKASLLIVAGVLALLVSPCEPRSQTVSRPGSAHTSQNALDWAGAYRGVLPCADCEGVETVVVLKPDGRFTSAWRYLGKNVEVLSREGRFTWNAAGSSVTLEGEGQYFVGEGHLRQLAADGSRITGPLAERFVLSKVPEAGLTGRYWRLVELNGQPVVKLPHEPWLILDAADKRVSGFGGCNSFTGAFTLDEAASRIGFSQVATTQMACIAGEDVERALHEVLRNTDNYSLAADTLSLNRARMAPLARFKAVLLP